MSHGYGRRKWSSQCCKRSYMMNQSYGWMGGGMWMWAALAVLVVIVVIIKSLSRK